MNTSEALLTLENISVSFKNSNKKIIYRAVQVVSFQIKKGEILGLVGESGCGKTTLGRTIVRLQKEDCGKIILKGLDLCTLKQVQLRTIRRQMQMIFQNPYSSLNPRMTAFDIISEPFSGRISSKQKIESVSALMIQTGLDPDMINKFPHEFSGGQRQRIAIARAVAAEPSLIIADEPVSSLDVSVQAQILNVLKDLCKALSMTMLFISHDLSVVKYISQRTAVMYQGRIVEIGPTGQLFTNPKHPYTRLLLNAVPLIDPDRSIYRAVMEERTDSTRDTNVSTGCPFQPRCMYAMEKCRDQYPQLRSVNKDDHLTACIRAEELPYFII